VSVSGGFRAFSITVGSGGPEDPPSICVARAVVAVSVGFNRGASLYSTKRSSGTIIPTIIPPSRLRKK
jgi:hypothetical protein